jgi:hypothetical protein
VTAIVRGNHGKTGRDPHPQHANKRIHKTRPVGIYLRGVGDHRADLLVRGVVRSQSRIPVSRRPGPRIRGRAKTARDRRLERLYKQGAEEAWLGSRTAGPATRTRVLDPLFYCITVHDVDCGEVIEALSDRPALPVARPPMKLLVGTCGGYHIGGTIGGVDVVEYPLKVLWERHHVLHKNTPNMVSGSGISTASGEHFFRLRPCQLPRKVLKRFDLLLISGFGTQLAAARHNG